VNPYLDPSATLYFVGSLPLDTVHDFTGPTTMQSIIFHYGGYSLSATPGAGVITLTDGIASVTNGTNGGTSTISLPLYFDFSKLHEFQINGSDTIVLSGSGNLSGYGFRKVGPGTLVMSGDHFSFKGLIQVAAGTL